MAELDQMSVEMLESVQHYVRRLRRHSRPASRVSATKADTTAEMDKFTPRVMRFKRGNPWYATDEEVDRLRYSAKTVDADCIVTRNKKDFGASEIPVYELDEFMVTAGFGGAGIAVPDGCTLEITSESDGTLHATGGKSYGGGAGIGSIGDHNNTNQGSNFLFPQGLGTIIINGGTIHAQGGTWYTNNKASGGAAGIGSSEFSGATISDTSWGGTTYLNNITGSITINGGTVKANGPLGFGEAIDVSQTLGASGTSIYRITYVLNHGTTITANPSTYETGVGVESFADPTRAGYDFGGWYDNDGFSGSPVTSIPASSTGNKTLYAKWTAHTYTITYEPNEGTMPSSYPTSYTIETPTFDLPTPTRSNYYVRGWYLNEEFASAKYTHIEKGCENQDRTFYAKWEEWDEDGDGSKWNPIKIRSEADLRDLAAKVNGGDRRAGVYYQ